MTFKFWLVYKPTEKTSRNKFFASYTAMKTYIDNNNINDNMIVAIRTRKQER